MPAVCASRLHGFEQPGLDLFARLVDDLRAGRPLGHRLADQQRDDRAGEADDRREQQQLRVVEPGRRIAALVEAEQPQHDRQDDEHREVRREEQDDALHGGTFCEERNARHLSAWRGAGTLRKVWGALRAASSESRRRDRRSASFRRARRLPSNRGGLEVGLRALRAPLRLRQESFSVTVRLNTGARAHARRDRRRSSRRARTGSAPRRRRRASDGSTYARDHALASRIEVVEIVALGRSRPRRRRRRRRSVGAGDGSPALLPSPRVAPRIARTGERHAEQAIVEPHLRGNRLVDGKPVDVALDLARFGARRPALRRRIVGAMHDGHVAARHPSRRRCTSRCSA